MIDQQEEDAGTDAAPVEEVAHDHEHFEKPCDCYVTPLKPVAPREPAEVEEEPSTGCPPVSKFEPLFKRGKKWFLRESIMWKDPHGWMDEGATRVVLSPAKAMEMGIDANPRTVWVLGEKGARCRMTSGRVHLSRMENSSVNVDLELEGRCNARMKRNREQYRKYYVGLVQRSEPSSCKLVPGRWLEKSGKKGATEVPAPVRQLVEKIDPARTSADCHWGECSFFWSVHGNRFSGGVEVFTIDFVSFHRHDGRLTCESPDFRATLVRSGPESEPERIWDSSGATYLGALEDDEGVAIALGANWGGMRAYSFRTGKDGGGDVDLDLDEEDVMSRGLRKGPCRD